MRFMWLVFWSVLGAIGLAGIVIYMVADYDYSRFVVEGTVKSLTGLRGWVRFYHEHSLPLLVAPLVALGVGVVGFVITLLRFPIWIPAVARGNSIASIAIMLSVVNFGILMWQIWPEGSYTPPSQRFSYSAPSGDFRDVTEQRIRQLERELNATQRELSDVRGFSFGGSSIPDLEREIQGLRECIRSRDQGYGLFLGC